MKSQRREVEAFLKRLHEIIDDDKFDIYEDLTLIVKSKSKDKEKFSTGYTMLKLDFDRHDIIETLKELTYRNYSETLFDRSDDDPPFLFVFGKSINGKSLYIKLKIRENRKNHILCLSFHYAEHDIDYPYC